MTEPPDPPTPESESPETPAVSSEPPVAAAPMEAPVSEAPAAGEPPLATAPTSDAPATEAAEIEVGAEVEILPPGPLPPPRATAAPPPSPPAPPTPAPPAPAAAPAVERPSAAGSSEREAALRAEIAAAEDPSVQAALHFELGALLEDETRDAAAAVKEYLRAFNADAAFHPPLSALLRIFERRRSAKNLGRLYDAQRKAAGTPRQQAEAAVDRGVMAEDIENADALGHFAEALEADPASPLAALMLERSARASGHADLTLEAVLKRAESSRSAVLRGLLLTEIGRAREADGDIDGALEVLQRAITGEGAQFRASSALESIARKHGRHAARAAALEGEAALAGAAARGEGQDSGSGAFSVKRFADQRRAARAAISAEYEAARLRLEVLDDPAGAEAALARAQAFAPEDSLLGSLRQAAAQQAGDVEGARAQAERVLARVQSGPAAARMEFRRAEIARMRGDDEGAREALVAAIAADPNSVVPDAVLDDLRASAGLHEQRLDRLEAQLEGLVGGARGQAALRAAQIAAEHQTDDAGRARAAKLYRAAAKDLPRPSVALRELLGVAERAGDRELCREALQGLLALDLDDEERATMARRLVEVSETTLGDDAGRACLDPFVADAFGEHPLHMRWAPQAARLRAALAGDLPRLAEAHRALAEHAEDAAEQAAHLCAAGRALARAGDESSVDRAIQLLRRALDRVPGHPYALALLEELHRSRGDAEEVVSLLREAAQNQQDSRQAELSLLMAGAAAEAAGDAASAAQAYEEAADRDPEARAPLLSLHRLGQRQHDQGLTLRALEGLSELELAGDAPGVATLSLGEHYDLVGGKSALAEGPLQAALSGGEVGAAAALGLLLLPENELDPGTRLAATERLLELCPEDAVWILREQAGTAMAGAHDPAAADESLRVLAEHDKAADFVDVARLARYVGDAQQAPMRAQALARLARGTPGDAGVELTLHAIRAALMSGSEDAEDDAFMSAQELAGDAAGSLAAAYGLDETLFDVEDAASMADAARAHFEHADGLFVADARAAAGRALGAAGSAREACALLEEALKADADDLASVEALRVAAREAGDFARVSWAAERLANEVRGELRARLLEEAAAVVMDHEEDDVRAEELLRAALATDPTSRLAYGRLRDLLAERGDTSGLLELTSARVDLIDDSEELVKLFYEQARLLRAAGDLTGALESLENLDMLNEEHEGAIALGVEIQVAREDYRGAVESLDRLAACDVPDSQKRLVRLGAADFLAKRLGDPEGALDRLEAVLELGPGDTALFERMARIAEDAGLFARAAEALDRAASASEGPARAAHHVRAGKLRAEHGDRAGGITSLRRALTVSPTDLEAASELADLLVDPEERRVMAASFEQATRARIDRDGCTAQTLTALRRSAVWRSERDLEYLTLSALGALGLATAEQAQAHEDRTEIMSRSRVTGKLDDAALDRLRPRPASGPEAQFVQACFPAVAKTTGLEPSAFGVGKGDLWPAKKPSSLRDELEGIGEMFGLEPGGLYVGGPNSGGLALVPGKQNRATWIVGAGLASPLTRAHRFEAARLCLGLHDSTLPLVMRQAEDAATLLYAAASAAQAPLAAGSARSGVGEWASALGKAIGWLERRALADAANALPDGGGGLPRFCADARLTSLRAGLTVSTGLEDALSHVLGASPTLASVMANVEARDLLMFWISDTHVALRRELGLSK